jgi:FMN reductase
MKSTDNIRISIVGIGGTLRPSSSTEKAVNCVLKHAESRGANISLFAGPSLDFPFYDPRISERSEMITDYQQAVRNADALVIASPAYHGGISGLVKNAIDYLEDMAKDPDVYLENKAVACIGTGYGWQGANSTLQALRMVVRSLRGWVSPLGIALNTAENHFADDGSCHTEAVDNQFQIMAQELIDFVSSKN